MAAGTKNVSFGLSMPSIPTNLISPPISQARVRRFGEEKVNLPGDIAKKRREQVRGFRERLDKWTQENPDSGLVKSYLSGSLAKGTALSVSSDVDVALYVKHEGERKADRNFVEWIAERIRKAFPQMAPEQIEPQEYSVKVTFKGAGVDIDIVPVFYEGDPQDKGWLVSKNTGRLLMTSIPMHLQFLRKRKDAQPQHFAQVVRLLKWWSAEQKGADASFRLKSFMVELICAHLADGGQRMADYRAAMEAFFNYVIRTGLKTRIAFADYYPASKLPGAVNDPVQIFDPVNPDNNVASQYTEENRRLIVTAAQDALDALMVAKPYLKATGGPAQAPNR
ncbi:MAG: nucleotidyltransferase [Planctomycetes bacterium]|nr:nucleotidyltransferase [Planctomycetota bacterium]